jgi:hypothetical protein
MSYLGLITLASMFRSFANFNGLLYPEQYWFWISTTMTIRWQRLPASVNHDVKKLLPECTNIIQDQNKVEVTLKLNKSDIGAVVYTFERFPHTIMASFQESEYMQDLKGVLL